MPISRVRWLTVYAIDPYRPTTASNERHAGEGAEQGEREPRRRESLAQVIIGDAGAPHDDRRVHLLNRLSQNGFDMRRNAREADDVGRRTQRRDRHLIDLKRLDVSARARQMRIVRDADDRRPRVSCALR